MNSKPVFSWAKNAKDEWVHVDSVPRGLPCNCFCPHCGERLKACQAVREHGFTHSSENRRANLDICMMVSLYKRAEDIIKTNRLIYVPSYYGIFPERDIEFVDVIIDNRYEREDKQPDVIAKTPDGKQFLIEFTFKYKVQHKQPLDYKNLTCLEVDLSKQSFDTLEEFLLNKSEGKKWINNENDFNQIEETYHNAHRDVRLVAETECNRCQFARQCCAVRVNYKPLRIENNNEVFRLCKKSEFQQLVEHSLHEEQARKDAIEARRQQVPAWREKVRNAHEEAEKASRIDDYNEEPSCYNCESNLSWYKEKGIARCGAYISLGISKYGTPERAKQCKRYKHK